MRCVNSCPFWEHAKRALLIVIFKRARLHTTSVGITTLAVFESRNRSLTAEATSQGLDGGRVGVLDGVELPIMADERINKQLDVPGAPRGRPLPEDTVEGTWVWGGVPEKLDKEMPFDSRQMRPCLQDGLKDEEGSVLVGGQGDTGDAGHRGKVEAFGGHDGWYAWDNSGIVVVKCGEKRREKRSMHHPVGIWGRDRAFLGSPPRHPEILLSGNYRFLFRPLCEFLRCKTVKKLGKVTVLQRNNSLSCQLRQIVKKLRKSQLWD
jgi:hypothetical protein